VAYVRRRVLDGARHPVLARETRARAEDAFALLEHGLGAYAVKPDAVRASADPTAG
jgi:hypothetical protein